MSQISFLPAPPWGDFLVCLSLWFLSCKGVLLVVLTTWNGQSESEMVCAQCLVYRKFSSVQFLSHVQLFVTPWIVALQAPLSITNSQSSPKLMSIESVMPSPPSHSLSSPSPPAFNLSQHRGLFKWVSSSHEVVKVLEFQLQHQSFQWTPRTDLL